MNKRDFIKWGLEKESHGLELHLNEDTYGLLTLKEKQQMKKVIKEMEQLIAMLGGECDE